MTVTHAVLTRHADRVVAFDAARRFFCSRINAIVNHALPVDAGDRPALIAEATRVFAVMLRGEGISLKEGSTSLMHHLGAASPIQGNYPPARRKSFKEHILANVVPYTRAIIEKIEHDGNLRLEEVRERWLLANAFSLAPSNGLPVTIFKAAEITDISDENRARSYVIRLGALMGAVRYDFTKGGRPVDYSHEKARDTGQNRLFPSEVANVWNERALTDDEGPRTTEAFLKAFNDALPASVRHGPRVAPVDYRLDRDGYEAHLRELRAAYQRVMDGLATVAWNEDMSESFLMAKDDVTRSEAVLMLPHLNTGADT